MADLFLIQEPTTEIKQHVIFIHGLQGHHKNTWRSSSEPDIFWPIWLSDSIGDLCIWSVGYQAAVSRWTGTSMSLPDRSKNILERILLEPKLNSGELLFIGHSLGGLIIKQILRDAVSQINQRDDVDSFIKRTAVDPKR